MNYSINTYEKTNKENQVYFKATFSTLEENEQEALQLLVEILQESVFNQEKMIHDILKQRIISLKQAITMSGHSLSMKKMCIRDRFQGYVILQLNHFHEPHKR